MYSEVALSTQPAPQQLELPTSEALCPGAQPARDTGSQNVIKVLVFDQLLQKVMRSPLTTGTWCASHGTQSKPSVNVSVQHIRLWCLHAVILHASHNRVLGKSTYLFLLTLSKRLIGHLLWYLLPGFWFFPLVRFEYVYGGRNIIWNVTIPMRKAKC